MTEQIKTPETPRDQDETAWLEQTARLVREGRFGAIDQESLSDYLSEMSRRDKREVLSRLTVLLAHLVKWEHQPAGRTASWEATILNQRLELLDLLESRTLENYARDSLTRAYARAVKQAAVEMKVERKTLSKDCPWTLEQILPEE